MAWQAVVGRADITPSVDLPMGGYGTVAVAGTPRTAAGTFSPLLARAVALWDDGEPCVLVAVDLLGWSAQAAATVRQRVTADSGLPADRLILTASHTHNGPALPDVADPFMTYGLTDITPLLAYQQDLIDTVVQLVGEVLGSARVDVSVDYQVTRATFSANREGLAYNETAVPVLVARQGTGQPLVVLFGYGAHPVSAGSETGYDGDYPAAAAAAIEGIFPGASALFLPGPAGDQDPVGVRGWPLRHRLGAQLAGAVVDAAAEPGRELTGISDVRSTTVSLPLDVRLTPANLADARGLYAARIATAGIPGWVSRHAQAMVTLIDSGAPLATAVLVPLQCWVLDGTPPLRLAFVGGELVSGYAVAMRQRLGGSEAVWLGGYGGALLSYLPSDELLPPLHAGGSYGGGWDSDHPGIAGGSMCVYGPIGHYLAGPGGIEPTLAGALTELLD